MQGDTYTHQLSSTPFWFCIFCTFIISHYQVRTCRYDLCWEISRWGHFSWFRVLLLAEKPLEAEPLSKQLAWGLKQRRQTAARTPGVDSKSTSFYILTTTSESAQLTIHLASINCMPERAYEDAAYVIINFAKPSQDCLGGCGHIYIGRSAKNRVIFGALGAFSMLDDSFLWESNR